MATHSSVLAWRIPGTGEPGGLPSMGSHRVGHDLAAAAAAGALQRVTRWLDKLIHPYWGRLLIINRKELLILVIT